METTTGTKVTLWIHTPPEVYTAARVDAQRWNGFAIPYFTLDEVKKIAADTVDLAAEDGWSDVDVVNVVGDSGIVWLTSYGEGRHDIVDEGVVEPTADGLYCVGGWNWTWSNYEEPES